MSPAIPGPRPAAEDGLSWPVSHKLLKSLLGAWALAACSAEETAAVEAHLTDCADCADEALRLRDAVALLHPEDSLDLNPALRPRVLAHCLARRPAKVPVPAWAVPYEAETARLDALLRDIDTADWQAPVRLAWFDGRRPATRDATVATVIGHLTAVDGLVAEALGLSVPLSRDPAATARAEAPDEGGRPAAEVRREWREQGRALVRTASFADDRVAQLPVDYGRFSLPLSDAFLDRAFECWVHAEDIAGAVDYPYGPPAPSHLNHLIDLAVRLLPRAIDRRRRAGLAPPPHALRSAASPGRSLHLEIEGRGGGHWYIALDSPMATGAREAEVAHVALESVEFCRLAAGRIPPQEAAAGQDGDQEAIRDVLFAAASLSRL
ncbi:maleylpyruvate isomerase family mycothiol-dependent enzyme [Streptomyces orinoci]|uniref:Maleylpyruvate isomerase family mycothiol-dependent enzyme n=1 Tax=Streptomyces orinoci TaxID=67339 RepID=A0ABV3JU18_STRON|nr:maleylpyruvate isomerase family mycothiol-dependent enzyme [Streptomyces orinoci]